MIAAMRRAIDGGFRESTMSGFGYGVGSLRCKYGRLLVIHHGTTMWWRRASCTKAASCLIQPGYWPWCSARRRRRNSARRISLDVTVKIRLFGKLKIMKCARAERRAGHFYVRTGALVFSLLFTS
jgi:hypothetical protein